MGSTLFWFGMMGAVLGIVICAVYVKLYEPLDFGLVMFVIFGCACLASGIKYLTLK